MSRCSCFRLESRLLHIQEDGTLTRIQFLKELSGPKSSIDERLRRRGVEEAWKGRCGGGAEKRPSLTSGIRRFGSSQRGVIVKVRQRRRESETETE